MGFELANWLVSRGAKNLFLVSRTGNCDAYKMKKIAKMRKAGVTVIISTEDITTPEGVLNLLKAANEIGYVLAIFNTTLVFKKVKIRLIFRFLRNLNYLNFIFLIFRF